MPNGPEYYLKRFYYDIAQAYHPVTLRARRNLARLAAATAASCWGCVPEHSPVHFSEEVEQ